MGKIKVAWITSFSDSRVRKHLPISKSLLERFLRWITGTSENFVPADYAVWISNGIEEMEKFSEVELHIISPCDYLSTERVDYIEKGINYHFFKNEVRSLWFKVREKLKCRSVYDYKENKKHISEYINSIKPDIIHLIGAENIYYSLSVLDIPKSIPIIVQLQTLISDADFRNNYMLSEHLYNIRSLGEQKVIRRSDFVGTRAQYFIKIIKGTFSKDSVFLRTTLPLSEIINKREDEKKYDFVYFAKDIQKSADYAIEAFALAAKQKPGITLDIVGDYSPEYKELLDSRLNELGITDNVHFEGKLPTHDDVLRQIRLSRFAVLPMKIDLITGTVRESMANGIPVVTTITPASPILNAKRESVLLSEKGDFQAMADNMLRLLRDKDFADRIRENALITAEERESNQEIVSQWVRAYYACFDNFRNGTPIPEDLLNK